MVIGLDGSPDFFHPPYSLIGTGATLAGHDLGGDPVCRLMPHTNPDDAVYTFT